jgi:hypothetical protein
MHLFVILHLNLFLPHLISRKLPKNLIQLRIIFTILVIGNLINESSLEFTFTSHVQSPIHFTLAAALYTHGGFQFVLFWFRSVFAVVAAREYAQFSYRGYFVGTS